MSDQHALWPYGPNHPKTIRNNEFWQKQSQLPPEAWITRGPGPGRRTTIAHPDHPLMGGPGWGPAPTPDDIAREEAQDRINNPHLWGQQQAPRPGGLQRAATGFADWMTGNKWDFDQRGPGGKFLDLITKGSKNEKTGTTFSQDVDNMPPIPPINPMDVLQMGAQQGRYNPFGEQTVDGVPRTPENSSIQQDPSGPYNPYQDQWIIDQFGNKVPRTPTNSVPGP